MAADSWKLKPGTTWRDKLQDVHPNHGKIVPANASQRRRGLKQILIPDPREVDRLVRSIPKGRLMTIGELRDRLGRLAGADTACPLTTGIFLRIVAEAAEEDRQAGKKRVTPYWRVVENDGRLRQRIPGGAEAQAKRLREEGLSIKKTTGKKTSYRVEEYERHLVS